MIIPTQINLKYLIVGTGRCGTVSVSKLLTNVGIPCGHESIFDSNGIEEAINRIKSNSPKQSYTSSRDGWKQPEKIIAESSYMAVPYLGHPILKKSKIIHIVRNPLEVVSSFIYGANHFQGIDYVKEWDDFIETHLPEINNFKTPIEKAVYYYVAWNRKINADMFHKIEDGYLELLKKMNLKIENVSYSEKANHFIRNKSISLKDIPKGQLKKDFLKLSEEYGYVLR